MLRLKNKEVGLPKVINTSERKGLLVEKSSVNSDFWSVSLRLKQMVIRLTKEKYMGYAQRMHSRKVIMNLIRKLGEDFVKSRQLECEVNEYDELQRLRYLRFKRLRR
jgi:hypothetical protein